MTLVRKPLGEWHPLILTPSGNLIGPGGGSSKQTSRDMYKEEDRKQVGLSKHVQNRIKGWPEKVKMRLSKVATLPTRRSLVDDLACLKENKKLANGNNNSNNDHDINNNDDHENEIERSNVASNSSVNENHPGLGPSPIRSQSPSLSTAPGPYGSTKDVGSPLPVLDTPEEGLSFKEVKNDETIRKPLWGKF